MAGIDLFEWSSIKNDAMVGRSEHAPNKFSIDKIVGRKDVKKPNYSKREVSERLLRAGDKLRRECVYLTPRQTLVVSMIDSTIRRMEVEY